MAAVADVGDPSAAAIGSAEAAAAHGLAVLRHAIADSEDNYTRFVVLSRRAGAVDPRVPCKTSLILVTRHEEGALLRCLEILSGSGHSMTKLESRPRPGRPWEYMFFLDFEGNVAEPRTAAALDELRLGRAVHQGARQLPGQGAAPAGRARAACPAPPSRKHRPRRWRRWWPTRRPRSALPGQHSWSTGPARQPDTVVRVGETAGRRGRVRGHGRSVLGRERRADRAPRRGSSAIMARTCCAAGCSSRGRRRTRSRGWAGQGLDLLVAAGTRDRAAGDHRGDGGGAGAAHGQGRRHPAGRRAQHAELRPAARARQAWTGRCCSSAACPAPSRSGSAPPSTCVAQREPAGDPLRARHPDVRERHPQHPRPVRGRRWSASGRTCRSSSTPATAPGCGATWPRWPGRRGRRAPTGLLIEVHPDPDQALSDADQSLSFDEFAALMSQLAAVPGPGRPS